MTHFFAVLAAGILAVELYANIMNSEGVLAWIHLVVIGGVEICLVGYLTVSSVRWLFDRGDPERRRGRPQK